MSRVGSVRGAAGRATGTRPVPGVAGFALTTGPDGPRPGGIAGPSAVAGAALSILQEDPAAVAARRDAAARRRATSLLDELGSLQRDLLAGTGGQRQRLERLAALRDGEDGADPALREIVRAVAVRAAIELAKRGF